MSWGGAARNYLGELILDLEEVRAPTDYYFAPYWILGYDAIKSQIATEVLRNASLNEGWRLLHS